MLFSPYDIIIHHFPLQTTIILTCVEELTAISENVPLSADDVRTTSQIPGTNKVGSRLRVMGCGQRQHFHLNIEGPRKPPNAAPPIMRRKNTKHPGPPPS